MKEKFDTWLSEQDIQRIWDVTHGNLPATFASETELEEFLNIVHQAWLVKIGTKINEKLTLQ